MPNNRISDLNECDALFSEYFQFNTSYNSGESNISDSDSDAFLMIARARSHNEKISLPNFKKSVIDNLLSLTGSQLISGHKTFTDPCTFQGETRLNKTLDITQTGDISGYVFVGESGLFDNLTIGPSEFQEQADPSFALNVSGSTFFDGGFTISGDFLFNGVLNLNNNIIASAIISTGTASFEEDIYTVGQALHSGDFIQTGDMNIDGDLSVFSNLEIPENIYHLQDLDSNIAYTGNSITLSAGAENKIIIDDNINEISFTTNNQKNISISDNTDLKIATNLETGNLSVGNNSYIESIYIKGYNNFGKLYSSSDKPFGFKTRLPQGVSEYTIALPRTYQDKPVLSIRIENSNGEAIIPFVIYDVTDKQYQIRLGQATTSQHYIVHTNVFPDSSSAYNTQNHMQTFTTSLSLGQQQYTISYPNSFAFNPVVTTTIEAQSPIVPYVISSVNTNDYTIKFGSQINSQYKIHTFSSRAASSIIT
jgi:hypothetical protein